MRWDISLAMSYSSSREIPLDVDELLKLVPPKRPEDEWQALMESPPGYEPAEPRNQLSEIIEAVKDAIDLLSEQDKYIVEAVNYERVTYEELSRRLGCSSPHAWRLKQAAYKNLGEILLNNELFRKYLDGNV